MYLLHYVMSGISTPFTSIFVYRKITSTATYVIYTIFRGSNLRLRFKFLLVYDVRSLQLCILLLT